MKRKYEKPLIQIEAFEANEYIAACWQMTCNVPKHKKNHLFKSTGYAYHIEDKNYEVDGYGCGTTYNVKTNGDESPKTNAQWKTSTIWSIDQPEYNGPIYLWKGEHFTKANTWVRDKNNAS
ncbi:MAG TPA: hypothetical protein DDY58_18335 [Terrisporobacter glycolicus]|uniref:hypothetical protein n=1 Tax=Terrisporobacter TaxID=1505652 RepID=UPI000E929771|nr:MULTISPECIES: hypothetical protein [Terrisporobacter]HBI94214.1 hypothetical protein [Terrisporobacter hibernicus]